MGRGIRLVLAGLVAAGMVMSAPAAFAKGGGGGGVQASGSCSASSTWKLQATPEHSKIQVEFEVDQNKKGDIWDVTITDNGQPVFQGPKKTHGPSGSFTVRKKTANLPGTDQFQADATNRSTGETCSGSVGL